MRRKVSVARRGGAWFCAKLSRGEDSPQRADSWSGGRKPELLKAGRAEDRCSPSDTCSMLSGAVRCCAAGVSLCLHAERARVGAGREHDAAQWQGYRFAWFGNVWFGWRDSHDWWGLGSLDGGAYRQSFARLELRSSPQPLGPTARYIFAQLAADSSQQ